MPRRACQRLSATFLVVVSLLFSQLALAMYACAPDSGQQHAEAVMEMAAGQPCEEMAAQPSQPVLCHQHCADAPQSFDAVKLPALSLPAVMQVLFLPWPLDSARQQADAYGSHGAAQAPPEPLFLSTLRLRV